MKVLSIHVGLSLGGVAKYAATLEKLRKEAHVELRSLCILTEGRDVDLEVLDSLDAKVVRVRTLAAIGWLYRVRKIITSESPDCVLSHGFNGHFVSLVCCAGQGRRINRLATYHGSYHATTGFRRLLEPLYNGFTHWFMRRKAKSVLCVAQYCARYLESRDVDNGKLVVIHNGIPDYSADPDARDILRATWGLDDSHVLIGTASRLDPVKGLDTLLEAFAEVTREFLAARLVMLGDGTMRTVLENRADNLGIRDRVVFTGTRRDVPDCLAAMDIFALPSLAEYHSIGLLEAMRAGLAIIATDVGGNTESIRHGREGIVVRPADQAGLAEAMRLMFADNELRTRLGQAARKRFREEFSELVMLDKTRRWLQSNCKT